MLKIQSLNFHYGKAQALNEISIEVKRGQITLLVGSNGAGKTTDHAVCFRHSQAHQWRNFIRR